MKAALRALAAEAIGRLPHELRVPMHLDPDPPGLRLGRPADKEDRWRFDTASRKAVAECEQGRS
jgi:hypothetical protein